MLTKNNLQIKGFTILIFSFFTLDNIYTKNAVGTYKITIIIQHNIHNNY